MLFIMQQKYEGNNSMSNEKSAILYISLNCNRLISILADKF